MVRGRGQASGGAALEAAAVARGPDPGPGRSSAEMEEQGPGDNPVLEVRGVADMPTDILTLYFENKRRSGGGTVTSIKRDGDQATITFENPADAQRVVSKPEHRFQDVRLIVKRMPPVDPRAVVLRDLNPDISIDVLTLYLEYISGLDGEGFTVHFSPDRTRAVVLFRDALSAAAVAALKVKAEGRCLHGANVQVAQLFHTDRVLVENLGPSDDVEIIQLYFESRRSDGGIVLNVTMLPGAKAIVEFQEWKGPYRQFNDKYKLWGSVRGGLYSLLRRRMRGKLIKVYKT